MTQLDDLSKHDADEKTRKVLELKARFLPEELIPYARLHGDTLGLWWRIMNQHDTDHLPPLDTIDNLQEACLDTQYEIYGVVREEHPEAIEQVIAERGL
jgi:hypothetical protein